MRVDDSAERANLAAELLDFALRHPTRRLDRQSARWMIETIGLSQDHLIDLADQDGRRLVATLVTGMENPDDAAELWVVGYRSSGPGGPAAMARALAWAEAKALAAGVRRLEITLPAPLAPTEPTVRAAGYELAYQLLTMVLETIERCKAVDLPAPSGCRWQPLDANNVATAHECYRCALASTSGAQVPSLETFRSIMLTAERLPSVLMDGERAIAYARVVWLDEAAKLGEVRLIARHPKARQPGLGKATLARALRELLRMGATTALLEVASDNDRAIGLYQRFGFSTRKRVRVYRRQLSGAG